MLTFKEMIYFFAVSTICFLACVFKTAYLWKGGFEDIVSSYILATFALFIGAFLIFFFLRRKCREYENSRKREVFLAAKKIKNVGEIIFVTVAVFFFASLFDTFNGSFIGGVYLDFTLLFTSYPLYEALLGLGVLIFGLRVICAFYETNRLYSIMEFNNLKQKPESVYKIMSRYPTFEEYERGAAADKSATSSVKKAYVSKSADQERFLKENEVPIDNIEKRLAGLDSRQLRSGRPVYRSTHDYGSTPSGDNSLAECPFCGSLNTVGSKECSFCGANIGKQ